MVFTRESLLVQLQDAVAQVELFAGKSRYVLFDNSEDPIRSINGDESFDCTIAHQLTEPGSCMYVSLMFLQHYVGDCCSAMKGRATLGCVRRAGVGLYARSPITLLHRRK